MKGRAGRGVFRERGRFKAGEGEGGGRICLRK